LLQGSVQRESNKADGAGDEDLVLGHPRISFGTHVDYFSTILGFEKFRAGQFGIRHYCCIGLNPKEANDEPLAEAVLEVLPHFAVRGGVVAKLGYNEQTPQEDKCLRLQIELASELDLPIMIMGVLS
jgi:predicted metal-dependent TIM-barrel fold hydrolase